MQSAFLRFSSSKKDISLIRTGEQGNFPYVLFFFFSSRAIPFRSLPTTATTSAATDRKGIGTTLFQFLWTKSLYNNRSKSLADTRKRGALLIMLAVLNREIVPLLCEKRDRRLIRLRLEQNQSNESNDLIKLRVNAATMEFDSKENFSFFSLLLNNRFSPRFLIYFEESSFEERLSA